jgi:aldehyde dehydrogenase family 7 protein A1
MVSGGPIYHNNADLWILNFRGRESGGDSWKQYVRWNACTSEWPFFMFSSMHRAKRHGVVNFSDQAPLAQGVNFVA